LLEAMLIDSDNTATDVLWREAGASRAVMARLARLETHGITVSRPAGQLVAAAIGLEAMAKNTDVTPPRLDELIRRVPRSRRTGEIAAFLRDPRDTTTPEAYVALLARIGRGEALNAANSALLLDVMQRCATGRARLRAGLPRGTQLAHKTGTLRPHVTNDAGLVTVPGGAHVAVVVLVRESPQDLAAQERAIAAIARAVYRHVAP
jgi:beta-lactamase class A